MAKIVCILKNIIPTYSGSNVTPGADRPTHRQARVRLLAILADGEMMYFGRHFFH